MDMYITSKKGAQAVRLFPATAPLSLLIETGALVADIVYDGPPMGTSSYLTSSCLPKVHI